jgi:5-formyltetrahydrofolate cyclo-ligase
MTLQNDKILLRKALREKLSFLHPERKEAASLAACEFLIEHLQNTSFKVLSFASKPFEINLWPLNRFLAATKRLLLPKIESNKISIYEVNSIQDLKISYGNIQEPCPIRCNKLETFEDLSLILVPGLGFDETHHRIGHGKGHYDKFLSHFTEELKWGVGFQEQKQPRLPLEDHDLALDSVLFF